MNKQKIPVIVGVAEVCEQVPEDLRSASSVVDLLTAAARGACVDAGRPEAVVDAMDGIGMVRTFADSSPRHGHSFGVVRNYPGAVAKRIGAAPAFAVQEVAGGNTPQQLVAEFATRLAKGEGQLALLMGGEAIATTKAALRNGLELDWSDDTDGPLEDRGTGVADMMDRQQLDNGLFNAPPMYALLENARRLELGLSREANNRAIGELFAPFSQVAAAHPTAMFRQTHSAEELSRPSDRNPLMAEPYTRAVVAKDGVNQAAAVILTTTEKARQLGIAEDRWIYPAANCNLKDKPLVQRPALASSPAMQRAYEAALQRAGLSVDQIAVFDLYSCFPIAVFAARDCLGLAADDRRSLTLTGGMPFFGGAGNNYAMHSVVNLVQALRAGQGEYGLVGANGGILTKHSVGVYSRQQPQRPWASDGDAALQAQLDAAPGLPEEAAPNGPASIETYTVEVRKGKAVRAFIIGKTPEGRRFIGATDPDDEHTPASMLAEDPLGGTVQVTSAGRGSRFTFGSTAA